MRDNFDKDHHPLSVMIGWAQRKACNFDLEIYGPKGVTSDTYYLNVDDLKYKLFLRKKYVKITTVAF